MLKYRTVPRKNPQTKEVKFYAQLEHVTPMTLDALAKDISDSCTLTLHDVKAVISALEEHISKALRYGKSVRLRDLGSFYPTLSSDGVENEKDFKSTLIKSVNVVFRKSAKMMYGFNVENPEIKFMRVGDEDESTTNG
ncbi:MAG: HU family DNA-binding protein [Bacteroidaceae bacterium]|jgi:predicted histone-like DNA-binding protein|nr:HU family DNA-binding protein [Bacteroidaceae bacterium]